MKITLVIALFISSSAFAREFNTNSTECKGKILTTSRSWESGMDQDESSSSVGKTNLKEGRDFSVEFKSKKTTGKKDDLQKCIGESGEDTGELTGSTYEYSTAVVQIKFSKSAKVPAKLRGQLVSDTLSCIDESSVSDMDNCP